MRRLLPLAGILFVCSQLFAASQLVSVLEQPPRDPRATTPTGTGVIKGRVVDAQTGAAVARAIVRVNGAGGPRPSVMTDSAGAFAFTALPAGSYTLTVQKSTYLNTLYPEPGKTLRSRAAQLTVADGQTLEQLTVPLYHGGVIAGRIIDAQGDPVEFVDVRAMRLSRTNRPSVVGSTAANDIGEFRLPRLQSGTYVLLAVPRRINADDAFEVQPIATYYPGVPALDQAHPITIERGVTAAGLELMLVEARSALVSGIMIGSDGQPIRAGGGGGGFINIRRIIKDLPFAGETNGTALKPDGTFELRLAPGEYELEGQYMPRPMTGPPRPEEQLFATARISVSGEPITGLVLVAGRGATVSGKFVFDGTAAPPANLAQARIAFSGPNGPGCRSGRSETAADGTFVVEGVAGTCIARTIGGLGGWVVKGVMLDRKNLLDEAMTFGPGQSVRDVQVIATDKRTELTLNVADDQGQLTREYVALMFPADEARWAAENSRYVRTYVPPNPMAAAQRGATGTMQIMIGPSGGFGPTVSGSTLAAPSSPRRDSISGIPSGDYYVVALDDLEVDVPRDAALFERLRSNAQRVTVVEGTTSELSLRRVKVDNR